MGKGGRIRIRNFAYIGNENFAATTTTFTEMVFGFLEELGGDEVANRSGVSNIGEDWQENMNNNNIQELEEEEEEGDKITCSVDEDKNFWEKQHQLLNGILYRSSSLESRIRNLTKGALKEMKESGGIFCGSDPKAAAGGGASAVAVGCRNCFMREICARLSNAGYNSAICRSKWRRSPNIPSGEHSFLDVIDHKRSCDQIGEATTPPSRVIIEINFRAEFEMARASEEYKELVRRLPEVFVGKVERLKSVIKILCFAAKKCMREKNMHLGPWRKHSYMQAKWLGAYERTTSCTPHMLTAESLLITDPDLGLGRGPVLGPGQGPLTKPKASMLTLDLHCSSTAVTVV